MEDSKEVKEVSEAPKTSEVKTEVKTEEKEEEMKDNSEAAMVDEDQRKLFVGGLAQVLNWEFSYVCTFNHFRDRHLDVFVYSKVQNL